MATQNNENNTGTDLVVLINIEKQFNKLTKNKIRKYSEESMKWYSRYIPRSYNNVRTSVMFRDRKLWTKNPMIGKMYFFEYDALHKKTLPVWDRYPIIFPFKRWKKNQVEYFTGINLHYLPPALRLKMMIALLSLRNEKRYRESTRLRMSWNLLKGLAGSELFKECVHTYRMDQMVSIFVEIPSQSWQTAVFLPLQRWVIKPDPKTNKKVHPWEKFKKRK